MAVYRYIYVFLFSIFICVSVSTGSYAKENGKGIVCTAYNFSTGKLHMPGSSLLGKIISSIDEAILVDNHVQHHAGSSQGRDRDNFSAAFIVASRWQVSTAALYFFFPAARGQIEEFIPIARLLIFPKHWFW